MTTGDRIGATEDHGTVIPCAGQDLDMNTVATRHSARLVNDQKNASSWNSEVCLVLGQGRAGAWNKLQPDLDLCSQPQKHSIMWTIHNTQTVQRQRFRGSERGRPASLRMRAQLSSRPMALLAFIPEALAKQDGGSTGPGNSVSTLELTIIINPEDLLSWHHGDRRFLIRNIVAHTRRA